jgi:SAM-dependent methyltransferase
LEVGAGNGRNFAHYLPAVTEPLAVEPEPYLRALAETAAQQAVVASLVLCSVPDQTRALAELRRVLRPGGELRFFEHVQADTSGLAGPSASPTSSGPSLLAAATPAATR